MTAPNATAINYRIPQSYLLDNGPNLKGFDSRQVLLMYVFGFKPSKDIKFGDLEILIGKGELSAAEHQRLFAALCDGFT